MPQTSDQSGCHIIQQDTLSLKLEPQHFSVDFWIDQTDTSRFAEGRGDALQVNLEGDSLALRQYRRGGMVRFISRDRYVWLGIGKSRPWREYNILLHASRAGLPVPEAVAACVCRRGALYRGSIMTRFIPRTRSLTAYLREQELPSALWYQLGVTIRQFHAQQIKHADLTSDNILIDDDNRFFLVDFDRARIMKDLGDWQWRPLYRFQQALQKRQKSMRLIYRGENWLSLMDGYQA